MPFLFLEVLTEYPYNTLISYKDIFSFCVKLPILSFYKS